LSGYSDGTGWVPIGTAAVPFTGTFDGDQYIISDLYIDSPANNVGLFGNAVDATLRGIRLVNVDVTGANYVGGLTGLINRSKVIDSTVTGAVTSTATNVGGLTGYALGTGVSIQNSYSAANVTGTYYVGGLAGVVEPSADGVAGSYASGHVSGVTNVGGLVGVSYASIRDSYATGDVTSISNAAGITVHLQNDLQNSFQTGRVTGAATSISGPSGALVGKRFLGLFEGAFYNATLNSTHPALGSGDPGAGHQGLSDAAMKTQAAYGGLLDFAAVWGINEGNSYPYLRAMTPTVKVNALAQTSYVPNIQLTVDGYMLDGSMGEPVEVEYEVLNSSNATVANGSQPFPAATGLEQAFNFAETLDPARFPEGWYTFNVTAIDDEGNRSPVRKVTFAVDHNPPALTLNGTNPLQIEAGGAYTDPGATAADAVDGDLTSQITVSGAVYTNHVGSYPVTYTVEDAAGNQATQIRTVNVVDSGAPVLTLLGANPMQLEAGTAFVDPGATAADAIDGDLTSQITVSGAVYANQVGTYSLTYSVRDHSGNSAADAVRTVHVVSTYSGGSPAVQLSSNANAARLALRIDGTAIRLTPAFDPAITDYSVETYGERAELEWATSDSKAKVTLENGSAASPTSIPLVAGPQTIRITVQAEDGTRKVYSIHITRLEEEENSTSGPACEFVDVQGHWAKADICEAADLKLVEGVSEKRYEPDREITRAELAVLLLRTLRIPIAETPTASLFVDEDSIPAWARPAIAAGAADGIIQGYPDGTFLPQHTISRVEMAAMLAKALKLEADARSALPFSDRDTIPAWGRPYVAAVYANGLMQSRGDDRFAPSGMTTRAEAAVVVLRIWKMLQN
jgi:hypothetical protein